MLIGAFEFRTTHAALLIGSTDLLPEVELDHGQTANSDGRHVMVRSSGQFGSTNVSLWHRAMPWIGDVVFDGLLDLPDCQVFVGDVEGQDRFVKKLGGAAAFRFVVMVDDAAQPSKIHVGINVGRVQAPATTVHGYPLPPILGEPDLHPLNALGVMLGEYDSPMARLAGAVKHIMLLRDELAGPSLQFVVEQLAHWLRRLTFHTRLDQVEILGAAFLDQLSTVEEVTDEQALSIATEMLRRLYGGSIPSES
ncbi:hypothetical protein ACFPIJ_54330 [Dactylosporangium cerinum]|uniref:Uncharacterized protein n=1 Tax=Dactylosporangium cerinum TaxID=1434730 RepID=A0ABV9WDG6_9ACTN